MVSMSPIRLLVTAAILFLVQSGSAQGSSLSKDSSLTMTCEESSHYEDDTCDKLTDGDLDTWWQVPHSDHGDWVRFDFSEPRTVDHIDLWSHTLVKGQCGTIRFEFSGGWMEQRTRTCIETASPTLEQFYFTNLMTDFVKMICHRRCPGEEKGWYLFAEMTIHGPESPDSFLVEESSIEVTCYDSSHYEDDTCDKLTDGDLDTWWQVPHSDRGEWVQFYFMEPSQVQRIDLWSHTLVMGQCGTLRFEFSGGLVEEVSRTCVATDDPALDQFYFNNIMTDYVTMYCHRRCPFGGAGWYLFAEMTIHGI